MYKKLYVKQIGHMNFTVGGEKIPWREVEGIGYQWYREEDKTWNKLDLDDSQLKKIGTVTHSL